MKTDTMGQLHRAAARCFQSRDAEWVPHLCRGGGHEWSANSRQRGADFSPRRLKSAARLPMMAGGVSEAARRAPHDAIHHALHDRAAEHARIRCFGAFTSAYPVRLRHLSAFRRNRCSKRRPAPTSAPFCNDSISGVSKCKVPRNDRHRRDPMGGEAGSLGGASGPPIAWHARCPMVPTVIAEPRLPSPRKRPFWPAALVWAKLTPPIVEPEKTASS